MLNTMVHSDFYEVEVRRLRAAKLPMGALPPAQLAATGGCNNCARVRYENQIFWNEIFPLPNAATPGKSSNSDKGVLVSPTLSCIFDRFSLIKVIIWWIEGRFSTSSDQHLNKKNKVESRLTYCSISFRASSGIFWLIEGLSPLITFSYTAIVVSSL